MKKIIFCFLILLVFLLNFNNVFALDQRGSLEVIYPNGGETLEAGKTYTVKWKQKDIASVQLKVSSCSSCRDILDYGKLQNFFDVSGSEGSIEWTIPNWFQEGDYKMVVIGYPIDDPNQPNKIWPYVEDLSDSTFTVVNNTDYYKKYFKKKDVKIDFKNLNVDIGPQDQFVFGQQYRLTWSNVCQGGQAYVYLVYTKENEEEYLASLRPFKFIGPYYGPSSNTNHRFGNGFVPNSIDSPNTGSIIWSPPTQLNLSEFSFNSGDTRTAVIIREKSGIIRIYEFQKPISAVLTPGTYKIRVDVRSNECNATGLSKNFQVVNALGDKIEENQKNTNNNTIVGNNSGLAKRLSGKLLLQVEDRGRIWYVSPDDEKRYEVTFANALNLFKTLALGINNTNLYKIPIHIDSVSNELDGDGDGFSDKSEVAAGYNPDIASNPNQRGNDKVHPDINLANRLKGKLLLQVEDRGRIWYVDFEGKRHEVTWKNLMDLFKKLSLGITNNDLSKIEIGN